MLIHGRSRTAAFMACIILLLAAAPVYPSYNTEAGHKYSIACQRLADLRKSAKKKKYRTYWVDCIRTFEVVEKKYPKSPTAAEACFDRAGLYFELYQFNKYSRDLDSSIQTYGKCQSAYPKHAKAPEGLYRALELSLDYKKNNADAMKTYAKLAGTYPESAWTVRAKTRLGVFERNDKPEPEIKKMPEPAIASGKMTPAGVVKTIRHWSEGAYTRIVIDQNGPVRFKARELKEPDRLVFDLFHARVDPSLNKEPLPINDGILKQVRASQYAPDTVRVVLDLESIKSYAAFPLHDPDRLVIDVTGEGGRSNDDAVFSTESGTEEKTENMPEQAEGPMTAQRGDQKTGTFDKEIPLPKTPGTKSNDGEKLSLSRQLGLKIKTIAIDAGHGGHDPGAIGRSGLKEKNITLDVARRLAVLVKERLGCNIVMTRDKDVFIPLEQRPFIAKSRGADLFVSIHVNANRKRVTRGIETYVQSLRASDREAMATAARENAMSTKKLSQLKSELDRIFADLTRDDKIEESLYLADSVQGALVNSLKPVNRHAGDLKAKIKRAFFYVLINTEMPSILAEIGFISNPEEENLLKNDSYRQAIAEALYQGVKKYVDARSTQMMGI
jgi:N-acetylmuramoyl-L-alanine amidase